MKASSKGSDCLSKKSERSILSAEAKLYARRNESFPCKILITKHHFYISQADIIHRAIEVASIDAITFSIVSSEFVLHVKNDTDERFGSPKFKRQIIELLVSLISSGAATAAESRVTVFAVKDLSLDLFVTTDEDMENGVSVRPRKVQPRKMNSSELHEFFDNLETKLGEEVRSTQSLLGKHARLASLADFDLLMVLGRGSHGKVLLAEWRETPGALVAIKSIRKRHIISSKQLEHTLAEFRILSTLKHPFLVSLSHCFHSQTKVYFVMDFMRGGELFQHMRMRGHFSEPQAKFLIACLVLALGQIHGAGYVYRDLKPENVLLDELGYPRLADFGLAKALASGELARTFCGTPEYLAPEVLMSKGTGPAADWWSLGVLAYELLFGAPPFYAQDVQEMYKRVLLNPLKFPLKTDVSKAAMDFCAGLLVKSRNKRLGSAADALEIMNHVWFEDVDWRLLLEKQVELPFKPNVKKWEKNFDPLFSKADPRESDCEEDVAFLQEFQKEFERFRVEQANEPANEERQPIPEQVIKSSRFELARVFRESFSQNYVQKKTNNRIIDLNNFKNKEEVLLQNYLKSTEKKELGQYNSEQNKENPTKFENLKQKGKGKKSFDDKSLNQGNAIEGRNSANS